MIRTIQCAALALAAMLGVAALMAAFSLLKPEVQIAVVGGFERIWISLMGNAAGVVAALIALGGAIMTWLNGRKATAAVKAAEGAQAVAVESRAVLSAQVDHLATQALPMAHMAGKREGYVEGIPEGKRQASGPMPLGK